MSVDWLARVASIQQWTRAGERAPHKPLLLLYELGRLQQGDQPEVEYSVLETRLSALLEEFGPPRKPTPVYPFLRLTGDGLWRAEDANGQDARALGEAPARLRAAGARGELEPAFRRALSDDPVLFAAVVRQLLAANFEDSLHGDVLERTGIDLGGAEELRSHERLPRRDPAFRDAVLMAYEYCCAFCGYDGQIGGAVVAIEAAHVRWWAFQGPETVNNGLALCSLHHRLFDRGAIGIGLDGEVLVSQRFVARADAARAQVLDLAGSLVARPQRGSPVVATEHRTWHERQVFRHPARVA